MQKRYPFKYLDAYTREDKDFYFGRNEEVKQLYEMTFQSDLLLVYGASGTGKTSLIQCGLANRFESHDWLALTIRRGMNINQSFEKILNDAIGDDTEYFDNEWDMENETDNSPFTQQIKTLCIKYFKPIYLIFDQFEELYILGESDEQNQFYKTVKQLLALNHPVKIIITIREEYLGHLYYFEQIVPEILRKKLRIEPMTLNKVREVLQGINNPAKSLVTLQTGAENDFIQAIFDKLREGKISIDLPYLQVLLDKLYLSLTNNDEQHQTETILTSEALEKTGSIGDILFGLLDGLVSQLKTDKNILTETSWKILSGFVTVEGTKEPLSVNDLQKHIPQINQNTLAEILQFFVSKRILRYDENERVYEIAHDTLAKQIHENRSMEEVVQLQIKKLIHDTLNKNRNLQEYFTAKQLKEIDLYIEHLELVQEEKDWIEQSRRENEKVEKQKKRTLWITQIALVSAVLSLIFAMWQWFGANDERKKAQKAEIEATLAKDELVTTIIQKIGNEESNSDTISPFNYNIPEDFRRDHPDLVKLILESKSISESKEKQSWFDLYPLMNDEQISKLRDILTREKEKLAEIEQKYQNKSAEIELKYQKYAEFNAALDTYNDLAAKSPKVNLHDLREALNDAAIVLDDLSLKFSNSIDIKPDISQRYGSLSWHYLFTKEYSKSEQSARRALELDHTQTWVKTNLAHALLFQNRFSEAEKIYKELSQTIYTNNETFTKTLFEDFDTLEKEGVIPPKFSSDVGKIRKMLNRAE